MNPETVVDPVTAALWREAGSGLAAIRVDGHFVRSPLAPALARAELEHVPMTRAADFASATLFEWPSAVPVLMSPSERYRVLGGLVQALRDGLPSLSVALVQLVGPDFNVQLPASLLEPDVLLVHQPLYTLPAVTAAGHRNVAVVLQSLRADSVEPGRNALTVLLVNPSPLPEAMQAMLGLVQGNGLLRALAGLRIQRLDAAALQALTTRPDEACA